MTASQLVEAGLWLQATGDVEGARRLFEQALKLDPENAQVKQLLGPQRFGVPPPRAPERPPTPSEEMLDPLPQAQVQAQLWFSDREEATEIDWGGEVSEHWSPAGLGKQLAPNAASAWDTASNPGYDLGDIATPGPLRRDRDPLDLVAEGTPAPSMPQVMLNVVEMSETQRQHEMNALLQGAKDLLELDDHTGAMELILKAQELDPTNPGLADLRERSESTLEAMFESKLGELSRAPRIVLKDDDIIWLNLDHRAGFVLAQIDGAVTFEDLFAVSGMSRLDTARILAQLIEEGVIRAA